ncbi:MAG: SDR family oxidoreductase, partial [Lentisphaeria bacterium]|nr:SDR family oxidoreductase [Lentisphaeria bacterium]
DVCQNGVVHTCQLAAMRMVEQVEAGRAPGRVVIIGSVHAEVPFSGGAPYNMAKVAINQFCEHLALELAPYHINVNTINPGWIDTPNEHRKFSEKEIADGASAIPWKRLGRPEEIAGIVQFLVGDDVSYMSGACIRADGAMLPALALHLPEEKS